MTAETSSPPAAPAPIPDGTEFLIHLAQIHETFRRAELDALAQLHSIPLSWKSYSSAVWHKKKTKKKTPPQRLPYLTTIYSASRH
jgi:tRNA G10  N-methylase Trm11